MGNSVAFFKGVRLWQNAGSLRAQPQQAMQPKLGASRARARLDNRSPNVLYQIMVNCWIVPIGDTFHPDSKSALGSRGKQVSRQVYSAKTLELLVDSQGLDKGLGQLAWVEDEDNYMTVSVGSAGGDAASITCATTASGWEPSVGDYVAIVDPSTGSGFTTQVDAYPGGGVLGADMNDYTNDRDPSDGEPVTTPHAVSTSYLVYDVAYLYDKVKWLAMIDPPPQGPGADKWSPNISYQFASEAGIIYPASYAPDFT